MGQKSSRTHAMSISSVPEAPPMQQVSKGNEGHVALLNGLGEVGDVAPALMPWLLRLAHIRCAGILELQQTVVYSLVISRVLIWSLCLRSGPLSHATANAGSSISYQLDACAATQGKSSGRGLE